MSDSLYPPPRPLSVGEVLDFSFQIYRRTFVKCLLFGALAVVANWLPNVYSIARGQSVVQSLIAPNTDPGHLVAALVGFLLAIVFPLAILCRQYQLITGQAAGGELRRAVRLLPRMILFVILFILVMIAMMLLLVPAFLVSGWLRYVLGTLLLLPMCYIIIRLVLGATAMVIEDIGATASLSRSWELSRGSVLRLIAIYSVAFFLVIALYIGIGSVTTFLYAVVGKGDVALIAAAVGVVTVAVGALATPYYSALGLAVFGDLVVRKEGADLSLRISAA